jgi:hypothetical protein
MDDIELGTNDIEELAAQYAAVFNEPDEAARAAAVARLWNEDARMCTAASEYVGLAAITQRVTIAHEKFVADQGYTFSPLGPAHSHHDGVRFRWQMASAAGGDAVSGGVQFLLLGPDRRVHTDYQFIDF